MVIESPIVALEGGREREGGWEGNTSLTSLREVHQKRKWVPEGVERWGGDC